MPGERNAGAVCVSLQRSVEDGFVLSIDVALNPRVGQHHAAVTFGLEIELVAQTSHHLLSQAAMRSS